MQPLRKPPSQHSPWHNLLMFAGLILALIIIASLAYSRGWLDLARLETWLQGLGPLAPLAFIVLMLLAVVTNLIPTLPLDILAGAVFGPWLGTLYALLGAELGAVFAFLIGRRLGRAAITRLLRKDIAFCDHCAEHQLVWMLFFARLIPLFSFELVSYGAGLTRMSLRKFALATLLGMLVPTYLFVAFGRTVTAGLPPLTTMLLAVMMVALFFLLPIWIKRRNPWGLYERMRPQDEESSD